MHHLYAHTKSVKDFIGRAQKTFGGEINSSATHLYTKQGTAFYPPDFDIAGELPSVVVENKSFQVTYVRWIIQLKNNATGSRIFRLNTMLFKNPTAGTSYPTSSTIMNNCFYSLPMIETNLTWNQVLSWYSPRSEQIAAGCENRIVGEKFITLGPAGSVDDNKLIVLECPIKFNVIVKDDKFVAGGVVSWRTDTWGECPVIVLASTYANASESPQAAIICQYWYAEHKGTPIVTIP